MSRSSRIFRSTPCTVRSRPRPRYGRNIATRLPRPGSKRSVFYSIDGWPYDNCPDTEIPAADYHHPIRQSKCLQDLFSVVEDVVVLVAGDVWIIGADHDLLDFLKLVDAEQASGIFAVGAGLSAVTTRDAGVILG